MRKQTKLVAVLSAAALLAIGASMTSFAATGWAEEDGSWVYLDKDGDRVTETWKKSGNQYFYLDENGEMATEQIIDNDDDKYFVDTNGTRVTNQWVSTENDDDWGDVETVWYYFGSTGKAFEGKKTINGKTYIFDEGGYMFSGWHERTYNDANGNEKKEWYYLGSENEGWAVTGWQQLEPSDEFEPVGDGEYDDEEWFNFKSSGVMRTNARAYIDGSYYEFDPNGVMISGWVPPVATNPEAKFYTESGNQPKGWVYTYAQNDTNETGDEAWYYLDSKGRPFNAGNATPSSAVKYTEGNAATTTIPSVIAKSIKSKTYLFDNTGKMLTGVYSLTDTQRETGGAVLPMDNGIYYFNKGDGSVAGQMVTGKTTVTYDGDNLYYNFKKTGQAYTNAIVDGSLYIANGTRISSDDGNMIYEAEASITDKSGDLLLVENDLVIVSASGKVKKSGNVTVDGTKYTVDDYKATMVPVTN